LCRWTFIACFAVAPVFGQTGSATVQGTVSDPTGAVVPGAEVTMIQVATSIAQKTKTNEVGFYLFPATPIGDYKLTVTSSGMETWEGAIRLQAGQAAVVDATLKVGATATQVIVGDVTPLVNTTSPEVSTTLERARIEQLPLNLRDMISLVKLAVPGYEDPGGGNPRGFGLRADSVAFLQDGAPSFDSSEGGTMGARPGVDSIQEMQGVMLDASAKFSRPGTVITVTKSGTNALHGAAYETSRNNSLGIARSRQNTFTVPPKLIRNEFGASIGGPVDIPKLYNGKNRTFFFFDFSDYYLASGASMSTTVGRTSSRSAESTALVLGEWWRTGKRCAFLSRSMPFTGASPSRTRRAPSTRRRGPWPPSRSTP